MLGVFEKFFAGAVFEADLYGIKGARIRDALCRDPVVCVVAITTTCSAAAIGFAAFCTIFPCRTGASYTSHVYLEAVVSASAKPATIFFRPRLRRDLFEKYAFGPKGPTLEFGYSEQSLFRLISSYSGAKVAKRSPDLPAFYKVLF